MTSRSRPSPRLVVPLALAVVALVVVVVFAESVLLKPAPTRPPTGPTLPPIAHESPTPTATPTEAPTPTDTPSPSPAPLTSTPPAITTAVLQQSSASLWQITYNYPQIQASTSPFADAIDAQLKSYVETRATAWSAGPASIEPPAGGHPNNLQGTYTIALATPGLLSLRLKEVEDLNGAHPSTAILTQTYDLSTGQLVGPGDLFVDQAAAYSIMSDVSRTALKQQLGNAYDPNVAEEGTRPDNPGNFGAWALTRAGLEITFQEYQVGPSAIGLPVVLVPWSALHNVINTAGPVASLAGA